MVKKANQAKKLKKVNPAASEKLMAHVEREYDSLSAMLDKVKPEKLIKMQKWYDAAVKKYPTFSNRHPLG